MNLNLILRNGVFVPCYEEDFERAKSLKRDTTYKCSISTIRNPEFNKKYHAMINRAWDCLNEEQTRFFGAMGKDAFRKSMEITAGFYEPVFSFDTKTWQKAPKSTSFSAMSEEEFQELYKGVYDAIRALLTNKYMSDNEFDAIFEGF